jgi:hypothetical protein
MKNLTILFLLLPFSIFYSQNKYEKLDEITENIVKLYIRDTFKSSFKNGDYIGIYIYSDSISNTHGMSIQTLGKDLKINKRTQNYRWLTFQKKQIIIFCDLNSTEKCNTYFENLGFDKINNVIDISDENTISDELDGEIKPWKIMFNQDYKIIKVGGKVIEAEIANPKEFTLFLKRFSNLKLYQIDEKGKIVYPAPQIR